MLIVDDEKKICNILSEILKDEGYAISLSLNGTDAEQIIENNNIDLVLLDLKLPDIDGITLLKRSKKIKPDMSIVMISAFGTISKAVEAIKLGADDFIEKPLETTRVLTTVKNTLEKSELRKETYQLKTKIIESYKLLGKSTQIKKVLDLIEKVAPTIAIVLIQGDSGTGKELVARTIHNKSPRALKPFVKVNCASIPEELIESELFGYEKGAFTGAYQQKLGQFELANSGTLFLDEIGDMSLSAQAKVLRAIEEKEIQHIGGMEPIKIDVRIIAATNKDLNKLIEERKFREDLYHRLNVITINVPLLRERKDDIQILANYFLKEACIENNRPLKRLTKGALQYLKNQKWTGNVRELKHLMDKIAILSESKDIESEEFAVVKGSIKNHMTIPEEGFEKVKEKFERDYIISILNKTGWKIIKTAKILKIDRSSLFRKMKKLKIKR
ncbi:sigma-54-dependent Fis family transcriptional regulator [candidate division WOR-3 bacterium]|nr:sigma-54-dependent Fis family transcriptional regulator [candidate division WOR-3 bacterium]